MVQEVPEELAKVPVQQWFCGREAPVEGFGSLGREEVAAKTFRGRSAPATPPLYGHFWKLLWHFLYHPSWFQSSFNHPRVRNRPTLWTFHI